MSDNNEDAAGGIHYHYHFYGAGAAAPGSQPGQPAPDAPPPFPPGFGAGGPGPGAANAHQHPGADSLIKGLVVGAGVAYLLSNETAQRAILRTAVQAWTAVQGGLAELKERMHDAEAEVAAAAAATPPAEAAAQTPPDAAAAAPLQEAAAGPDAAVAPDVIPGVIAARN